MYSGGNRYFGISITIDNGSAIYFNFFNACAKVFHDWRTFSLLDSTAVYGLICVDKNTFEVFVQLSARSQQGVKAQLEQKISNTYYIIKNNIIFLWLQHVGLKPWKNNTGYIAIWKSIKTFSYSVLFSIYYRVPMVNTK